MQVLLFRWYVSPWTWAPSPVGSQVSYGRDQDPPVSHGADVVPGMVYGIYPRFCPAS